MNMEKDILDKLKKPSFSTPEGYFDKLKAAEGSPGRDSRERG